MKKEQFLAQTKRELESMEEYKVNQGHRTLDEIIDCVSRSCPQTVQEQQNNEIKRLQEEISRLRSDHVHEMSQIKIQFQRDIQRQRVDENSKVEEIRRQADRVR